MLQTGHENFLPGGFDEFDAVEEAAVEFAGAEGSCFDDEW